MRSPLTKTILSIALTFCCGAFAEDLSAIDLSTSGARDAAGIARELFEECPPQKCIFVSLGSQNVVLDSYLRVLAREEGGNLRYVHEVPFQRLKYLKDAQKDFVEGLYGALLPSIDEIAGRQVIFLRSLFAGVSMSEALGDIVGRLGKSVPPERIGAAFILDSYWAESNMPDLFGDFDFKGYRGLFESENIVSEYVARKEVTIQNRHTGAYRSPIEEYHRFKPVDIYDYREGSGVVLNSGLTLIENPAYLKLDQEVEAQIKSHRVRIKKVDTRGWSRLDESQISCREFLGLR